MYLAYFNELAIRMYGKSYDELDDDQADIVTVLALENIRTRTVHVSCIRKPINFKEAS